MTQRNPDIYHKDGKLIFFCDFFFHNLKISMKKDVEKVNVPQQSLRKAKFKTQIVAIQLYYKAMIQAMIANVENAIRG